MFGTRVLAVVGCLAALSGVAAAADDAEGEAVKAVVRSAYVEGVHAKADPALMRKGFHPDFRMFTLRDGALAMVTLDEWAGRIEKGAAERKGPAPQVRGDFSIVDVTGNAALAKVELFRDGKHVFSDYLSLYKFPDGWKIVAKTFHTHKN
jgi:hypothetical protein